VHSRRGTESFQHRTYTHIKTRGNLFNAFINLYKAMEGGWIAEAGKKANPE
jgi:outer membrane protein TolC